MSRAEKTACIKTTCVVKARVPRMSFLVLMRFVFLRRSVPKKGRYTLKVATLEVS